MPAFCRRNPPSFVFNYKNNLSPTQNSFTKNKPFPQIHLNKSTIIKRMQTLMLNVKDLDTKMFISKTISYLTNHIIERTDTFKPTDISAEHDKLNLQPKVKSNLFSNNFSQIKPSPTTNSIDVSMMIPAVCDSNHELSNDSKCFGETAASQGFLNSNNGFKPIQPSVIEETVSEAGTIQCECGLLGWLLQMVSQLMEIGIVKNRNQKENQFLEIDETFIQEITKEIINSWSSLDFQRKTLTHKQKSSAQALQKLRHSHLSQLQKSANTLANKLKQNQKLLEKIKSLSLELEQANQSISTFKFEWESCKYQLAAMQQLKVSVQDKLSGCLRNLERSQMAKSFVEQAKNLEIQSLKFQIQLKDNQISNLKTIIQTLQKRSREYDSEIQILKKSQSFTQQGISIAVNYAFDIEAQNKVIASETQGSNRKKRDERNSEQQKQLKQLRVQNVILRQQCILLYEQVMKRQLF